MTSRALQIGGELHIDTTPRWGTKVRATLPHRAGASGTAGAPRWQILIAHDHPVISAGLIRLLSLAEPAIQVTAEIDSADQLIAAYGMLRPDVILIDLDMVHQNTTGVVARIRELDPDVAIVVLTDNPTVEQVRSARQMSVRGFVSQRASGDTIARTLVAACQGQALVEGDVFDHLLGASAHKPTTENFTSREKQVCSMVIRGLADKQIASELQISVKTVEKHVGSVLRKTGARNRTMLAVMAVREPEPPHPWG